MTKIMENSTYSEFFGKILLMNFRSKVC